MSTIIGYYDFGTTEDGRFYDTVCYADGTYKARVTQVPRGGNPALYSEHNAVVISEHDTDFDAQRAIARHAQESVPGRFLTPDARLRVYALD